MTVAFSRPQICQLVRITRAVIHTDVFPKHSFGHSFTVKLALERLIKWVLHQCSSTHLREYSVEQLKQSTSDTRVHNGATVQMMAFSFEDLCSWVDEQLSNRVIEYRIRRPCVCMSNCPITQTLNCCWVLMSSCPNVWLKCYSCDHLLIFAKE